MNHRRWHVLPAAPAGYLKGTDLHPLTIQLLHNRGIAGASDAMSFLGLEEEKPSDPFLLPDIEKAVVRVQRALLGGETIAIYGDFDADGICGTAVLVQGLSRLGANTIAYIPHRVEEGYGLNFVSLERLCQQGATVVVTVDCGITNAPEIEYAGSLGLDTIVTDHHSVTQGVPPAFAVVNPKRADSAYPFPELAGVGVAYRFLQALFMSLGRKETLDDLLDIVAVGTVADMVPLLGDNRSLVKEGLVQVKRSGRLGLQEMLRTARVKQGDVDSGCIAWVIAPRLNAPGRLEHALASYQLLMTQSPQEARQMAQELEETNAERQRLTSQFLARARDEIESRRPVPPLLIAGGEGYPSGVAGLIAGRLVEEYHRPSIVFKREEETSRGSARSIPGFSMIAALAQCTDLLERFGGHPMAAGFTVRNDNVPRLSQRLVDIAGSQISEDDLQPSVTVDAELPLSAMNGEVFGVVERLAPFGSGNPAPVFVSRGVKVVDCASVGDGSRHLQVKLREGRIVWRGIGFDLGHLLDEVSQSIDVVYTLSVDRWGGEETLSLSILDFAPAQ